MTGKEIYYAALALTGEPKSSETDYDTDVVVGQINVMMPEIHEVNQALRKKAGEVMLTEIPSIQSLEEDIPLAPVLARTVIPYGLAAKLLINDDELSKAAYYNGMFTNTLNQFDSAELDMMVDLYGGDSP